ncbi:peptidase S8/S53 domain-containing protein [Mycena galopus ATCC 62051]|nr:peptidase S8/S53 domain-containing protein [Mycena galopus ATCC 62051]
MVLHESISHVPLWKGRMDRRSPSCYLLSPTELRSATPSGYKSLGSPSPTQEIDLLIALVQSNITGLAKVVDAVSIPSSSSYGQYLTAAEVAEYVKPPADSLSTVMNWVTPNVASVKPFSPAGDILQVSLTVEQAEGLFNTRFSTYIDSASGREMIRALNYSLPSAVQQHILHVHPIIAFTPPPQRASKNTVSKRKRTLDRRQLAPCEDIVRPVCLQEFYGIPNTTISGSTTNTIGVQGFVGEYANVEDLSTFLDEFRPDIAGNTFSDTINWLLSQSNPPTVFTTSYGNAESDFTQSAATSVCNGYMQLAAIGISMIFSSGDGGASDSEEGCMSFVPMFPPTCPYVTSVGGTFFQPPTAFVSSAGGFSNYFAVPSYQAADTSAYLESIGDEYSGMYNPNGRGFPDVASEWEVTSVGGTSCASPIFASFIALVNDRLIAAGKPVLGFLNPVLYSTGKGGLDDVAVGRRFCIDGWNSIAGWDPVSGLGTPDFAGMMTSLGI